MYLRESNQTDIFLLRDAMHKCGLCRHAVSVCLSVCHVCEQGRLHHRKLCRPRGVYTVESLEQMLQKNFRGEDLTSNQGGGNVFEKNYPVSR